MKIKQILGASILLLSGQVNAALMYEAIDLGSVDGFDTFGQAISNSGLVAGRASGFVDGNAVLSAVIGDASGLTSIQQLGTASFGSGVNSAGQSVGFYFPGSGRLPFVYENGVMRDPGRPDDDTTYRFGQLNDINEAGISVGRFSRLDGTEEVPYAYDVVNDSWHELDVIEVEGRVGGGNPGAINERGQIAGTAKVYDPDRGVFVPHAARWDLETGEVEDLGTLGYLNTFGQDINNFGAVTGYYYNADLGGPSFGSFLNDGGTMFDIGVPENFDIGIANGINDLFQVVGRGTRTGKVGDRGLYWDPIEGWLDLTSLVSNLDDLGWSSIDSANDINNRGQITGWGTLLDGKTKHAFILNPILAVSIPVTIDIKPGSDPNSINPRSQGVIPVAVLGSIDFDATQIDYLTVRFGIAEASPAHDGHVEDVNDDGYMDAAFHFRTQETGIVCGDTEATLIGEIYDGTPITGTDTVNTVGCKGTSSEKSTSSKGAGAMNWMLLIGFGVLGLWRLNRGGIRSN